MVYLLTQRRYDIVRHFLTVCLDLQSTTYQTAVLYELCRGGRCTPS